MYLDAESFPTNLECIISNEDGNDTVFSWTDALPFCVKYESQDTLESKFNS